jgi:hypothetical protein
VRTCLSLNDKAETLQRTASFRAAYIARQFHVRETIGS